MKSSCLFPVFNVVGGEEEVMDEKAVIVEDAELKDAELVLCFFFVEGVLEGILTVKGKCVGRWRG